MTFGEVLQYFKDNEQPDSIAPIIDDASLRNGIVAWKSMIITYKDNEPCPYNDEARQWEWLWTKVSFDLESFGKVAGFKPQETGKLFERLKGLRLIYPDGTVNNYATQYLQSLIIQKLPKKKK